MGNHALLSPSSSHRWLSCTPSAVLETEFENKSSNAAEEGTAFHALCEHKLKKALRRRSKRPVSAFNTDEMEEHSDGYVEFVLEQLEKAKQTCPDPLVLIEQKVDLSDFVPGSYGTADCLMVSDDTLHIIDAIHESELQNLVVRAINMALGKRDSMNDALQRNVEAVLTGMDGVPLDEIDARLEELQKELLKVANAKGNYDSIVDEIYSLREAKQNAQVESAEREGMKKRISEMQQFLAEQQQDITEYDEQLVRRLIEKITVYDERVTVEFKSGTSVDVRR